MQPYGIDIPEDGLAEFIKTLLMTAMLPLQAKFAWQRLKMLTCIAYELKHPPMPGA
jgi:hypothetical protein